MPVDITVDYLGERSVVTFEVMPTFEQLRYCIKEDFVGHTAFEMRSQTLLRGTPITVKDQHALHRVCSDGRPFSISIDLTEQPPPSSNKQAEKRKPQYGSPGRTNDADAPRGGSSASPIRGTKMFSPASTAYATASSASNFLLRGVVAPSEMHRETVPRHLEWLEQQESIRRSEQNDEALVEPSDVSSAVRNAEEQQSWSTGLNSSPSGPQPHNGKPPLGPRIPDTGYVSLQPVVMPTSREVSPSNEATPAIVTRRRSVSSDDKSRGSVLPEERTVTEPEGPDARVCMRMVDVLPVQEAVSSTAVSGDFVWEGDSSSTAIFIRDMESGTVVKRLSLSSVASMAQGRCNSCTAIKAVGADAMWVGYLDGTVAVVDVGQMKEVTLLRGHRGPVTCICDAGGFVFSGSEDTTVRQYDSAFVTLHNILNASSEDASVLSMSAASVPLSTDAKRVSKYHGKQRATWLFTGCANASIMFWDADTGELEVEICDAHKGAVRCLELEPCLMLRNKGKVRLWSGGNDGIVRVWDASWTAEGQPSIAFLTEFREHKGAVLNLQCLEGRMLSLSEDRCMIMYQLQQRGAEPSIPAVMSRVENGSRATPYTNFAVGSTTLLRSVWLCGGLDRTISVWQVPDEMLLPVLSSESNVPTRISAKNRAKAVGDDSYQDASNPPSSSRSLTVKEGGNEVAEQQELVVRMRQRMVQRQLMDCVSEEFQVRYTVHLEHERDFFRLVSLHDTLVRANFYVATRDVVRDSSLQGAVAHAHLGAALLEEHGLLVQLSTNTLVTLQGILSDSESKIQKLMFNYRQVQTDLETKLDAQNKDVDEVVGEMHILSVEFQQLRLEHENTKTDCEVLQSLCDQRSVALSEREKKITALEEENQKMESEFLSEREAMKKRFADRLSSLEAEFTELRNSSNAKAQEWEIALEESEARERGSKMEINTLQQRISLLEDRISSKEKSNRADEEKFMKIIEEERTTAADMQREWELATEKLKESAASREAELQRTIDTLQSRLKESQATLDALVLETKKSIESATFREQESTRMLDDARKSLALAQRQSEDGVKALQHEVSMKQERIAAVSAELETSREALLQAINITIPRLMSEKDELTSAKSRLEAELRATGTSSQSIQAAQTSLVAQLKQDVAQMEKTLGNERAARKQVEGLLVAAEEHYEAIRRQMSEEIERIRQESAQEQQRSAQELWTRETSLASQLRAAESTTDSLREKLQSTGSKLSSLEALNAEKAAQVDALSSERGLLLHDLTLANDRIDKLSATIEALKQNEKRTLEDMSAKSQSSVERLQKELNKRSEELSHAEERCRSLEAKAAAANATIQRLEEKSASLEKEVVTSKGCAELADRHVHELAAQVSDLRSQRDHAKNEASQLLQHIQEIKGEALRVRLEADNNRSNLDASSCTVSALEDQNRQLMEDVDMLQREKGDLVGRLSQLTDQWEAERRRASRLGTVESELKALQEKSRAQELLLVESAHSVEDRLRAELVEKEQQIATLQSEVSTARTELMKETNRVEEFRTALTVEATRHKSAVEALEIKASYLADINRQLEACIQEKDASIKNLHAESLNASKRHVEELRSSSSKVEERWNRAASQTREELQLETNELRQRLDDATARIDSLIQTVDTQSVDISELTRKLNDANEEHQRQVSDLVDQLESTTASLHAKLTAQESLSHAEVNRLKSLCDSANEELLLCAEKLRIANKHNEELHEDNNRTIRLLDEAQEALKRAATAPSPLSSAPSSPAAQSTFSNALQQQNHSMQEKRAMISVLRQVIVVQHHRDSLFKYFESFYTAYMDEKMALVTTSFIQLASAQTLSATAELIQAIHYKMQRDITEPMKLQLAALQDANDKLVQSVEERNVLLDEAQDEIKAVYTKYKAEVEAHKATKQQTELLRASTTRRSTSARDSMQMAEEQMYFAQQVAAENERLKTSISLLERERALILSEATTARSGTSNNVGWTAKDEEDMNELLDGFRDAVDLLQPLSQDPPSFPSGATLTALYDWLLSAQYRCETIVAQQRSTES